jgi:chromosome partitioning protein
VRLWGVLPTQFDGRARICHEAVETLREHFGERCLEPIHANIKVKEAPSVQKTLFEYAPATNAAADYHKLVERLLSDAQKNDDAQPMHAEGGVG